MKDIRKRNIISLILNILMFIFVLGSVIYRFTPAGEAQIEEGFSIGGTNCLVFFTVQSNILAAITSLLVIPYNIKSIKNNSDLIPKWTLTLKFIGTVVVTVTLMVVLLFLGPTKGYLNQFKETRLFLHLICPLLSIVSFCFFERGHKFSSKEILLSLIPELLYGLLYLYNVVITSNWPDFYGFNIGGRWYITYIVILVATYIFSFILCKIHNKFEKTVK